VEGKLPDHTTGGLSYPSTKLPRHETSQADFVYRDASGDLRFGEAKNGPHGRS
jgi:hypothetical protein